MAVLKEIDAENKYSGPLNSISKEKIDKAPEKAEIIGNDEEFEVNQVPSEKEIQLNRIQEGQLIPKFKEII